MPEVPYMGNRDFSNFAKMVESKMNVNPLNPNKLTNTNDMKAEDMNIRIEIDNYVVCHPEITDETHSDTVDELISLFERLFKYKQKYAQSLTPEKVVTDDEMLRIAINELHKSNDITDAAYSTLMFALKRQPKEQTTVTDDVLGLSNQWPLVDVLKTLVESAEILLHKNNYDRHNHEEVNICVKRGKEIIALLQSQPKEQTTEDKSLRDELIEYETYYCDIFHYGESHKAYIPEKVDRYLITLQSRATKDK